MRPLLLCLLLAVPAAAEDGLDRVDTKALLGDVRILGRAPADAASSAYRPADAAPGRASERHVFAAGFQRLVGPVSVRVEPDGAAAVEALHKRRALWLQTRPPLGDQAVADRELREEDADSRARFPGSSMYLGVDGDSLVGLFWQTGSAFQPWQNHTLGLLEDARVSVVVVTAGRDNQTGARGVCASFRERDRELFRLFITHDHYFTDRPTPVFKSTCGTHLGF